MGADLAHIVGTDNGNLGLPAGAGGARTQVTYAQAENSFAKDRIGALVTTANNDVVITGVNSTFILQGGIFAGSPLDGRPITDVGGGIVAIRIPQDLNAAGTGVPAGTLVPVIYDTGGCNGAGYCVPGAGGASVADPTDVVLFHELAHAFHMVTNVFDVNNIEPPARSDENQLRAELVPPLAARDTASNVNPGCGTCGTVNKQCLIVTAAYGSPYAPAVRALQRLRDTVLRRSAFGNRFFEQLLNEYYRFSPQVAAEMDRAPRLRELVRRILVEPLVNFLEVTERYIRGGWTEPTFADEVSEMLRAAPNRLDAAEPFPISPLKIHTALERLRARLNGAAEPIAPQEFARTRAGDLHAVVDYLAWLMRVTSSSTPIVRWALLEPAALYWAAVAHCQANGSQQAAARQLLACIDTWLGSTPIPSLLEYESERALRADLAALRETVFVIPSVRTHLGRRLLLEFPGRVPGDLVAALQASGYLPQSFSADAETGND